MACERNGLRQAGVVGSMNPDESCAYRRRSAGGYTLVELMVVITLLAIMLGISLPRLYSVLVVVPSQQIGQWFGLNIPALKAKATETRLNYILYCEDGGNRFYLTTENGRADDRNASTELGEVVLTLPDSYRLEAVTFPLIEHPEHRPRGIRFFKQGYSDHARLHISNRREHHIYITIEPFLSRPLIEEKR